jgi:hypothetical protein
MGQTRGSPQKIEKKNCKNKMQSFAREFKGIF